MSHQGNLIGGLDKETGEYDYTAYFTQIAPVISRADLACGNLETPIAGAEKGYAGYPAFNAPDALLYALRDAGFDVLTTANNHALDKGKTGMLRTRELLQDMGFHTTGTYDSKEERDTILVVDVKGIQVAILAYTYGANGVEMKYSESERAYMLAWLHKDRMVSDVRKARGMADIVLVFPHWGKEYERSKDSRREDIARALIAAGADAVLASHPHVVQPVEWVEVEDEQGGSRYGFIAYSMGNFISDQRARHKEQGLIVCLTIEKPFDGLATIRETSYVPTYVVRYRQPNGTNGYHVVPAGISGENGGLNMNEDEQRKAKRAWKDTTELLGDDMARPLME